MTSNAAVLSKERLREALDAARQRLFGLVTGLTEEQMRRRPGPDLWSVAEVLAHLPVSERCYAAQARAACARRGSAIELLGDEERAESAARGRRLPPPALIHDLVAARWETTSFLDSLRPSEMARSGAHQDSGALTVAELLDAIASHENEHVAQIGAVRQALGL